MEQSFCHFCQDFIMGARRLVTESIYEMEPNNATMILYHLTSTIRNGRSLFFHLQMEVETSLITYINLAYNNLNNIPIPLPYPPLPPPEPNPLINIAQPPHNIPPPEQQQITMCRYGNGCPRGDSCDYAHSAAEMESGLPVIKFRFHDRRNNVNKADMMEYFGRFGVVRYVRFISCQYGFVGFRLSGSVDNVFTFGRNHVIRGFDVKVFPDRENGHLHHLERVIELLAD